MATPAFLITIDTEGDNAWSMPRHPTTENAKYLGRFQSLCEAHQLKPTWLTDWEMANDGAFVELALDGIRTKTAEVGMHLHAWSQPPFDTTLTEADWRHCTYLIEYPESAMRDKVRALTSKLAETFDVPMTSHRAGRWALDERYARILVDEGYMVDCSVTPHVTWTGHAGSPHGTGGSDYTSFPEDEYFVSLDDISRVGSSPLLEIPMTVMKAADGALMKSARTFTRGTPLERIVNRCRPGVEWLRPTGRNLQSMLAIVERALAERRPYVEFMLHSSEFMPGGSPTFQTSESIERLYAYLNELFSAVTGRFAGMTLSEYRRRTYPEKGV